ncbi:MAG TPA: site-specific DNA-methyltransferase [Ignavibacteriales bacterium]|nr:site-specific DNA-methyltransferase [Ignavibacteriales bacterium]
MLNHPLPRIDKDETLRKLLLPYCRFNEGTVWNDKTIGHKIACIDISNKNDVKKVFGKLKAKLSVQDPPYNFIAFKEKQDADFIKWCKEWIALNIEVSNKNSSFYFWLGADQSNHFEPFGGFIEMMKLSGLNSRSFITMRNQRGYGTQYNWMAIRQELLFYTQGKPKFNIKSEYTDIPKVLKGYYKEIGGDKTENLERSKSHFIRAGNVWIDVQQVFYRMEENVNGCYAQKPLKAIKRIIEASTTKNELVTDFFSHSGTTLIACELLGRKCYTFDYDPVYCEISLRRLENYRETKKTGWQNSNPFFEEIIQDKKILSHLRKKYNITYS